MGQPIWAQAQYFDMMKDLPIIKRVDTGTTITGTTAASVWTPATGKKFRLRFALLYCYVTTILASATVGDGPCLLDGAAASPILQLGRFAAANDAAGTAYTFFASTPFSVPTGLTSSTANNVLKIAPTATISTGVVRVIGVVGGDEV